MCEKKKSNEYLTSGKHEMLWVSADAGLIATIPRRQASSYMSRLNTLPTVIHDRYVTMTA